MIIGRPWALNAGRRYRVLEDHAWFGPEKDENLLHYLTMDFWIRFLAIWRSLKITVLALCNVHDFGCFWSWQGSPLLTIVIRRRVSRDSRISDFGDRYLYVQTQSLSWRSEWRDEDLPNSVFPNGHDWLCVSPIFFRSFIQLQKKNIRKPWPSAWRILCSFFLSFFHSFCLYFLSMSYLSFFGKNFIFAVRGCC